LSLEYQDTTIRVVGPAAIVRFHWVAEQEATADGKKTATNLHILMNWQKQARTGNSCPDRPPSSDRGATDVLSSSRNRLVTWLRPATPDVMVG
jgi:hypothetical protein